MNAAEIQKMLQEVAFSVRINCNDTFGYACADAVDVEIEDLPMLIEVYQKFGHHGVTAFCAKIEKCDVLKELKTKEFLEAKEYLEDYQLKGIDYEAWQVEIRKRFGL